MGRQYGCIWWFIIVAVICVLGLSPARGEDWKAGQESPAHDADRLYPLSDRSIVLENGRLYLAFDQRSGALVKLVNKASGWQWQTSPRFGESFRLFAPTPDRSYSPVLGFRNVLSSFEKSKDGCSVQLVWSDLQSEYQGKLDITLRATVALAGDTAKFEMVVTNHSQQPIVSVSWPILGSVEAPGSEKMTASIPNYGGLSVSPLYNPAVRNDGYHGTNYPTNTLGGRFILVATPREGLYVGSHNPDARELVKYQLELKPGYETAWGNRNPQAASISGHPVRVSVGIVHFPFLNAGESGALAPIVLGPYTGDWHAGVDIYKRWKAEWYRPRPMPSWVTQVHSWLQLQINSAEDDLRTTYVDLPRRVKDAADNGVGAVQLVGWSVGGQDRDNPSADTDPRLGSTEQLKQAIAEIERMGVRVNLFAKYPWADRSTEWYKQELYKYMATDPYGNIYSWGGYKYQTPEQLAGINTRTFATACSNNAPWQQILAREFQKIIDLGGSGALFDEAQHRQAADLCFSPDHGHRVPATIWSGDKFLGDMFHRMVRESVGEEKFLFSGEDPEDAISEFYPLSYFRIGPGHIPEERYAFPFRPLMIAVTGFDDREMINRALMYRYIISYEPFNFKGNISDFPLTISYGKKVDALRKRYEDYLWDAEFRDTLEAAVTVEGKPFADYTVFLRKDGRKAIVVTNAKTNAPITATVGFGQDQGRSLICASPEKPDAVSCSNTVSVPPRSAIVIMQR